MPRTSSKTRRATVLTTTSIQPAVSTVPDDPNVRHFDWVGVRRCAPNTIVDLPDASVERLVIEHFETETNAPALANEILRVMRPRGVVVSINRTLGADYGQLKGQLIGQGLGMADPPITYFETLPASAALELLPADENEPSATMTEHGEQNLANFVDMVIGLRASAPEQPPRASPDMSGEFLTFHGYFEQAGSLAANLIFIVEAPFKQSTH